MAGSDRLPIGPGCPKRNDSTPLHGSGCHQRLKEYVEVYLNEEIREVGEIRELDAFERFMEVAAISLQTVESPSKQYSRISRFCMTR